MYLNNGVENQIETNYNILLCLKYECILFCRVCYTTLQKLLGFRYFGMSKTKEL